MADIDPSEHTIDELEDELADIEDPETLEAIREAESNGENRAGAKETIDERIETVSDEEGESESASDGDGDESEGENGTADSASATGSGIVEVRNRVRNTAGELIGRPLDGIVEIERTDDGWRVAVEIIERSSVPDTQDIIGRYALELDGNAEITGYRRLDRYRRGNTRREEPGAEAPR